MATFESLGLCEWLIQQCKQMGISRPTPVQEKCIPAILEGKDVFLIYIITVKQIQMTRSGSLIGFTFIVLILVHMYSNKLCLF